MNSRLLSAYLLILGTVASSGCSPARFDFQKQVDDRDEETPTYTVRGQIRLLDPFGEPLQDLRDVDLRMQVAYADDLTEPTFLGVTLQNMSGSFVLSSVPAGSYVLCAAGATYISRCFSLEVGPETTHWVGDLAISGDFDRNNVVDDDDIDAVEKTFDTLGTKAWDLDTDGNGDGSVDFLDLDLVLGAVGSSGVTLCPDDPSCLGRQDPESTQLTTSVPRKLLPIELTSPSD